MDNELTWGMITKGNRASLSLSIPEYEAICEGFGSDFCLDCSFTALIPEDCLMQYIIDNEYIVCSRCSKQCPCNRSLKYEEVRKEIIKAEIGRCRVYTETFTDKV